MPELAYGSWKLMADGIDRLIAILGARARELEELANDAHDLVEIQLSKDIQEFLLHHAENITSEIAVLRKLLEQLIKQSEDS
jgi:hypothetical protein